MKLERVALINSVIIIAALIGMLVSVSHLAPNIASRDFLGVAIDLGFLVFAIFLISNAWKYRIAFQKYM